MSLRVRARRFNIGCLEVDSRRRIASVVNDAGRVQPAVAAEAQST
jgi:hypothetical protein